MRITSVSRTQPRRDPGPAWWFFVTVLLTLFSSCPNVLSVCPSGCALCDDENLLVNCIDANLDFVPITLNPLVQKLLLRNNRIRSVETGFGFYHELDFIDLSHNHLLKISPGSFSTQSKLAQLHLNNNKITSLSNLTFGGSGTNSNNPASSSTSTSGANGNRGGLQSLIHLNLRVNLLETIQPGVFIYTKSLQELDLGENTLSIINSSAFLGLESLRILRLDHNELRTVPQSFSASTNPNSDYRNVHHHDQFEQDPDQHPLSHLVELFMGMNPIQVLERNAFGALPNLAILDLKGCQLRAIHEEAFTGLSVLKKLILSDNNLKSVPAAAWPPLRQLEVLRIGRNPISSLPSSAFSSLRVLKVMEMSGAPELMSVDSLSFASNFDLEMVEISSATQLGDLPSKLFNGISSLRTLILKQNALRTLPEDLASWQSLRTLRLEGNPFHCSCDLNWLRDLLVMSSFKNTSFLVLCDGPLEVAQKRVSSLTDKELNCTLNGAWQQTLLGISLSIVILLLIIFFFLLYRFHDQIKDSWKRNSTCFRRRGRNSGLPKSSRGGGNNSSCSGTVKAAELDTSTKSSFLSHQSAYPYSGDEEFALRTSLMSSTQPPTSGQGQAHYSHTLNPNTLHRQLYNHNYPSSLHPFQGPPYVHGHPNGKFLHYPTEAEYETPLDLGMGSLYGPIHNGNGNHGNDVFHHHPHPHQQQFNPRLMRPIPITEL